MQTWHDWLCSGTVPSWAQPLLLLWWLVLLIIPPLPYLHPPLPLFTQETRVFSVHQFTISFALNPSPDHLEYFFLLLVITKGNPYTIIYQNLPYIPLFSAPLSLLLLLMLCPCRQCTWISHQIYPEHCWFWCQSNYLLLSQQFHSAGCCCHNPCSSPGFPQYRIPQDFTFLKVNPQFFAKIFPIKDPRLFQFCPVLSLPVCSPVEVEFRMRHNFPAPIRPQGMLNHSQNKQWSTKQHTSVSNKCTLTILQWNWTKIALNCEGWPTQWRSKCPFPHMKEALIHKSIFWQSHTHCFPSLSSRTYIVNYEGL